LRTVRREAELGAAAERPAARRDDDGERCVAHPPRDSLEQADHAVQLVPLALLGLHQEECDVRAGREVRCAGADHQAVVGGSGEVEPPSDEAERVEPDDVQLPVELQAEDAVAQVRQRSGGVRR
jgi:hypothetical protein